MRELAILSLLFVVIVVIIALYRDRLPHLVAALAGSSTP